MLGKTVYDTKQLQHYYSDIVSHLPAVYELIRIAEMHVIAEQTIRFCSLRDVQEYTTLRILPLLWFAFSPLFLNLLSIFLFFFLHEQEKTMLDLVKIKFSCTQKPKIKLFKHDRP